MTSKILLFVSLAVLLAAASSAQIGGILDPVLSIVVKLLTQVLGGLTNTVNGLLGGVIGAVGGGVDAVESLLGNVINNVIDNLLDLVDQPLQVISAVLAPVTSLLNSVLALVTLLINTVLGLINGLVDPLLGTVVNVADSVLSQLTGLLNILLFIIKLVIAPFANLKLPEQLNEVVAIFRKALVVLLGAVADVICKIETLPGISSLQPLINQVLGELVSVVQKLDLTCPLDVCEQLTSAVEETLLKAQCKV